MFAWYNECLLLVCMQYAYIDVYFLVPLERTFKGHSDEKRGLFVVSHSCHVLVKCFPFYAALLHLLPTWTISLVRVSPSCIVRENDDRQLLFYAILCFLKRVVRLARDVDDVTLGSSWLKL